MPVIVQKYGGTSVADAERIRAVADRVVAARRGGHEVVVVVSAMGDTTDELMAMANQLSTLPHPRELDLLLTAGERIAMSLLAIALNDQGFPAAQAFIERWLLRESRVIVADKQHTNYKSHLQEDVQSTFRTHPVYRIRSEMGPDHSKQFNVEVLVGRRSLGVGKGRNKKTPSAPPKLCARCLKHSYMKPTELSREQVQSASLEMSLFA